MKSPTSVKPSDPLEDAGRRRSWRQWLRAGLASVLPRRMFLVRGPAGCRSVCLTFDDGPHPEYTPRLLDVLKECGVPATFFVIGQQAERHPEIVRRMADEGHAVGHHSYFHEEPHRVSARQLSEEVRRTRELLRGLLGTAPDLFRPPYGNLTAAKLWRLWGAGQSVVLWSTDPMDYARRSADEVGEWFERNPLSGGDLVLLHDAYPYAAAALPGLVDSARARGLTFETVPRWAGRSSAA